MRMTEFDSEVHRSLFWEYDGMCQYLASEKKTFYYFKPCILLGEFRHKLSLSSFKSSEAAESFISMTTEPNGNCVSVLSSR